MTVVVPHHNAGELAELQIGAHLWLCSVHHAIDSFNICICNSLRTGGCRRRLTRYLPGPMTNKRFDLTWALPLPHRKDKSSSARAWRRSRRSRRRPAISPDWRHTRFHSGSHANARCGLPRATAAPALQPSRHGAWRMVSHTGRLGCGLRGPYDTSCRKGFTTLELKVNMIRHPHRPTAAGAR